jgi:hypothetical protein
MKLRGSLPCSQQPVTGPYPESDESSPHPHILFLKIKQNGLNEMGHFDRKSTYEYRAQVGLMYRYMTSFDRSSYQTTKVSFRKRKNGIYFVIYIARQNCGVLMENIFVC